MLTRPKAQQGNMLVLATFVIVVMTLLSITIVTVLSNASQSVAYEVLGLRAQHAARSGLEQHLSLVFKNDGTLDTAACAAPVVIDFAGSAQTGLNACVVQSQCENQDFSTSDGLVTRLSFTSTGQCAAGEINVSRSMTVEAVEKR